MGWDVVQIGLRHNLPVEDPIATTQEVAKRMKRNIRLVYRNEYECHSNKIIRGKDKDISGNNKIFGTKVSIIESERHV